MWYVELENVHRLACAFYDGRFLSFLSFLLSRNYILLIKLYFMFGITNFVILFYYSVFLIF